MVLPLRIKRNAVSRITAPEFRLDREALLVDYAGNYVTLEEVIEALNEYAFKEREGL